MKIIGILDEDRNWYKKPNMYVVFPKCVLNCEGCIKEKHKIVEVEPSVLVERYRAESLVCGGLEPFDSFDDLFELIVEFRKKTLDDVVIYTGYKNDEVAEQIEKLKSFPNIIVKFGRFIPNQEEHFDEVLGKNLPSLNQYAVKIS